MQEYRTSRTCTSSANGQCLVELVEHEHVSRRMRNTDRWPVHTYACSQYIIDSQSKDYDVKFNNKISLVLQSLCMPAVKAAAYSLAIL